MLRRGWLVSFVMPLVLAISVSACRSSSDEGPAEVPLPADPSEKPSSTSTNARGRVQGAPPGARSPDPKRTAPSTDSPAPSGSATSSDAAPSAKPTGRPIATQL